MYWIAHIFQAFHIISDFFSQALTPLPLQNLNTHTVADPRGGGGAQQAHAPP